MLEIVLIRPGCTDYDLQGRIQGNLDVPLNERGKSHVQQIAEEIRGLGIEALYCACGEPVTQAATILAEALGVKLRKMDRMQNLNHGLWQGMLIEDVRVKQPRVYRQWQEHPETVCPPEGEMLFAAAQRVEAAITRLLKRHKEGVIAVLAPEPLATLIRCYVTHGEIGDLWKALEHHGRWEVLTVDPALVKAD